MAKIVKSNKAPEGELDISIGNDSFKVGDNAPYETDDLAIIEFVTNNEWLSVDTSEEDADTKATARSERNDQRTLQKARAKANKINAEKDPTAPAVADPTTVEEAEAVLATSKTDVNAEAPAADSTKGDNS